MAIALVGTPQLTQNNTGSNITTLALPAASHTAGNALFVFVSWLNLVTASVTNTAGDTFTACAMDTNNSYNCQWFYAKNIAGHASDVVTVALSGAGGADVNLHCLEYSGIDLTAPLDVNTATHGSGSTITSNTFTTATADQLILHGGAVRGAVVFTAGTGYVIQTQNNGGSSATEDKIVSSVQTNVTSTMTFNNFAGWGSCLATFKAAAAAVGPIPGAGPGSAHKPDPMYSLLAM